MGEHEVVSRRRPRAGIGCALFVCLHLLIAQAGAADLPDRDSLLRTVLDITSFTRWPEPGPALRLCVVGPTLYGDAFFDRPLLAGNTPALPRRLGLGAPGLAEECDIVYHGPLSAPAAIRLMRELVDHPVLTLGENSPACSDTTMLCLRRQGERISFSANLDLIARSGLRLSPRVLLLNRREATP